MQQFRQYQRGYNESLFRVMEESNEILSEVQWMPEQMMRAPKARPILFNAVMTIDVDPTAIWRPKRCA